MNAILDQIADAYTQLLLALVAMPGWIWGQRGLLLV
jgi:hypothetical protein